MIDADGRAGFDAVHLMGSLEAAVYKTLADMPTVDWTCAELGEHVGVDVVLVHAVLRQFAAAGIVDAFSTAAETRYRWRPTSLFLGDRPSSDAVRDPVCGMWVMPSTQYALATVHGTEYFCSQRCLSRRERERR